MKKSGFTIIELIVSVGLFMLAITIAVTTTVGSSNIINRTDQRALVVESARSAIDLIRQQSTKMDPNFTQVSSLNNGLTIGQYSSEVKQNVCIFIAKGNPISTTDLVGDSFGPNNTTKVGGFYIPDGKVDDFDFSKVVTHFGGPFDTSTPTPKYDPNQVDSFNAAARSFNNGVIDPTKLPPNGNFNGRDMSYWRDHYVWNQTKGLFTYDGDTNNDNIVDNFDFANVVLNFGSTTASGNAQKYSFYGGGKVLMMFAYQLKATGCVIGSITSSTSSPPEILFFGPLHDPEKVVTDDISVMETNDTVDVTNKKYMIRIKLVMEEAGIKQSLKAQKDRSQIELLTGIPIGLK